VEALRWTPEDTLALEAVASSGLPTIAAVNKVDTVGDKEALLPYLQALADRHGFLALVPVSAARGDGIEDLERTVLAALPEGEPRFPEEQITDRSERFFAAELLREQLVQRYGQELPYRTTVEIERFEDQGGRYLIHALVWVERPGQKAIVIGKGGEALKAAATQARLEMQKLFDRPVRLEVWVKVKKSWSSDEAALASLGYRDL
jgi:GTP-binding protein Era